MFKELAFTPFIFDEAMNVANRNWTDCLRELIGFLFPRQSPYTYMISNLHSGNWISVVIDKIGGCTDHSARILLEQLYTKVHEHLLVKRPSVLDFEYPGGDDQMWADEALQSSRTHGEIDRVFACPETAQGQDGLFELRELLRDSFIENLLVDGLVPRVIDEQIRKLEKICLHASYISICSGFFHSNELDFAKALIQKAGSRPPDFDNVIIDIHIKAPEREEELNSRVNNVCRRLQDSLTSKTTVRLYVWRKILDRVLLAGDATTVSGGLSFKPRWGINTSHIAKLEENNPDNKSPWSVMKKHEIIHWNKIYYQSKPILGPLDVEH